jgi:hypothetical protein
MQRRRSSRRGGHLSKPELKYVLGFEVLDEMAFSNGAVCSSPMRRQISSASNALSTSWVFERG